jgi:polyribonucleotide nucleotidyltransferase
VGKPKNLAAIVPPTPGLHEAVAGVAAAGLADAVRIRAKQERRQAFMLVDARVEAALSAQFSPSDIKIAMKAAHKIAMRQLLRDERLRSDGRGPDEVRTIRRALARRRRQHGVR